jgi:hypothetical protein
MFRLWEFLSLFFILLTSQFVLMVCRQAGQVRKCFPNSGWLARFQFWVDGKKCAFHGPARAGKDEAEADRRAVAVSMAQANVSSRVNIASRVLQSLKDGRALLVAGTSSSSFPVIPSSSSARDAKILLKMQYKELRDLATRTAGVQRNKKNSKGKWVPKTSKEIVTSLLAMRANIQTQALPGSNMQAEYPSGARFSGGVKKRPATAAKHCASTVKRRPASIGAAS